MKIRKYVKTNEHPFISPSIIGRYSPVCNEEFQSMLADYIKNNYGQLFIRETIEQNVIEDMEPGDIFNDELNSEIQSICTNLYLVNQYKYEKLYETTTFEYNPIENYSMTEHGTDVRTSKDDTTFTKGEQTDSTQYGEAVITNAGKKTYGIDVTEETGSVDYGDTSETVNESNTIGALTENNDKTLTYGEKTHTENLGERSETETIGGVKESDSIGGYTDTNAHSVSPFDSSALQQESQDTQTVGAKSNSHTEDPRTNTKTDDAHVDTMTDAGYTDNDNTLHTIDERTDTKETTSTSVAHSDTTSNTVTHNEHVDNESATITNGAHADTATSGGRSDTTEVNGNETNEHDFKRSGNIGVTTSQQMIESQRQLVDFNFVAIVAKDVIKKIANLVYKGDTNNGDYGFSL